MTKAWATLLTSGSYLPGVLVLDWALKQHKTAYPLVVLYTVELDKDSLAELQRNGISTLEIELLKPQEHPDLTMDQRFLSTWSKLSVFNLTQFNRVVQLDCDMLPVANMDELMELSLEGFKFASTHACVCNPLKKGHYPSNWTRDNCLFTNYEANQQLTLQGKDTTLLDPDSSLGLSKCNSGILVVEPSKETFQLIKEQLMKPETKLYHFPDQDLLSDLFYQNWLPVSYNYNFLKTMVHSHSELLDLNRIKNIHYILSPKPWETSRNSHSEDPLFKLWWDANDLRLKKSNVI